MSEVDKTIKEKEVIAIEQFDSFVKDLNDCIEVLKGKKLDKATKYKFCKKVRKVVARYLDLKLSETDEVYFEDDGNDVLIKYPYKGGDLTLIRFGRREVNK